MDALHSCALLTGSGTDAQRGVVTGRYPLYRLDSGIPKCHFFILFSPTYMMCQERTVLFSSSSFQSFSVPDVQ
jgi:hypothetical protein